MHEAALALAAIPSPSVVLGMALAPYSLGHELFLIREENPLAIYGEKTAPVVKPESLVKAVLICCQSFEDCIGMQSDLLLSLKIQLWKWRVGNKANVFEDLKQFRQYQTLGCLEFPRSQVHRPGNTPGRTPGAPFILRLYQFLITKLGLPSAAAWNYPLGLAKMQYQTYWESEGGLDIYNDHDRQFDDFCEKMEAKEAAEKGTSHA